MKTSNRIGLTRKNFDTADEHNLVIIDSTRFLVSLSPLISSPPLSLLPPSPPASPPSPSVAVRNDDQAARPSRSQRGNHAKTHAYRRPRSRWFMTQIQAEMATQLPQSLPSFAQTFGGPSLNRLSDVNNALPPIQHRPQPIDRSRSAHTSPQPSSMGDHKQNARKRLHSESTIADTSDTLGLEYVLPFSLLCVSFGS